MVTFMRKILVFSLAFVAACSSEGASGPSSDPSALPPSADNRSSLPRGNGYLMEVHPMEGRVELIALAPPPWVPLNYSSWAIATSGTGANTVTLHTPSQNSVTYTDGTGVCHSNGTTGGGGCGARAGACLNNHTFCAPVQLTNNFTDALPDVILQAANNASDTRNAITACGDGGDKGQCFSQGTCNNADPTQSSGNAAKVDCANSALSSPVGSGSTGCSYCYGNAGAITGGSNDGIRDVVLNGVAPGNLSLDTLALVLSNDNSFGVTLTANYDTPFMDQTVTLDESGTPVTCATPGFTNVTATGGGFGPPAGCTNSNCQPLSGGPFNSSYIMDFVKNGGTPIFSATNVVWSDNKVQGIVSSSATGQGSFGVRIRTPFNTTGVLTSPTAFQLCQGGGDLDHFNVTVSGNPQRNHNYTFTVVAIDTTGGLKSNFTGTITMTISEQKFNTSGTTTETYTFVAADNGSHRFTNEAFSAVAGTHTISVTDNATPTPHTGSVTYNVR
jgi:hypothetical protein